jgi:hypothetical protein
VLKIELEKISTLPRVGMNSDVWLASCYFSMPQGMEHCYILSPG